jgi:hypothetical protein
MQNFNQLKSLLVKYIPILKEDIVVIIEEPNK